MLPTDEEFGRIIPGVERFICEQKEVETDDVRGLPGRDIEVAFVVKIDSSSPGSIGPAYRYEDMVFFCFGNVAFRPGYFEWDGDPENNIHVNTYSLRSFSRNALSWKYLASLIFQDIQGLEKLVPRLPRQ